ncbi:hypothetical protein G7054_g8231 [Neopestalotiopsis clavispora]|nr:hypothetical protein G7054_g8231 [Neopestalotiopsis clavispora]
MVPSMKSVPAGPGLLFIQVQAESAVSDEQSLANWFQGPNLLGAPSMRSTSKLTNWKCADPSAASKYLSIWNVEDLAATAEEAGDSSSINDIALKGAGNNDAVKGIKIDMRYFSLVEEFAKSEYDETYPITHIITAGMEPSTPEASADLDKWYTEEHNEQMSLEPGWVRSRRYKLADEPSDPDGGQRQRITWMTIHEFGQGNRLGNKVEPLDPITPWTRKVMGEMSAIEADVWINTCNSSTSD